MTADVHMLTPWDFLSWLAAKVEEVEDREMDDLSSSLLSSDRLQDAFPSLKAAGV